MNIVPISESAVVCSLPPPASIQQQRQLWAFARQLQSEQDIVEVVLGMNNLTVFTDFFVDFKPLVQRLEQLWAELKVSDFQGRHIEIPVIYGGERGQDLSDVAKFHQTTPERIIQMHSEPIYTVYMIGFQAGFPYLGGLPENLHTPRRASPRTVVPSGSVGIGGRKRAQDISNAVFPKAGYFLAALIVMGGLAFNIGNVGGAGLGLNSIFGIAPEMGAVISGIIAILIFLRKEAGLLMDRFAQLMGFIMVALTFYVMFKTEPPVAEAAYHSFIPEQIDPIAIVTLVGGTVGGYITFAGAHRLLDAGIQGEKAM